MSYTLEGKIKQLHEKQTFGSGFEKREFVVTTQEQYPQDIKLECVNDKIDILNSCNAGDEVKVSFNLRGNEYQGRYFVNLQAWKLEKSGAGAPAGQNLPPIESEAPLGSDDEVDDLPF